MQDIRSNYACGGKSSLYLNIEISQSSVDWKNRQGMHPKIHFLLRRFLDESFVRSLSRFGFFYIIALFECACVRQN